MGPKRQIVRTDAVVRVNILDVLPHQTALDVVGLQIGHGHDHHVRIHLHHQGDELHVPDVVSHDPGFAHGKDRVLRVGGDIVDRHIGMGQGIFDHALEVFVEAAALAVEHQALGLFALEEPVVVRFLLLLIGLQPLLLGGLPGLDLAEVLFALLQGLIVDGLGRRIEEVHKVQVPDGKDVADDPVDAHAGRDQEGEIGGKGHRKQAHAPLTPEALLPLEHVVPVLGPAQGEGGKAGQDRHQAQQRKQLCHLRHRTQVDPQEVHIHRPGLGDHILQAGDSEAHEVVIIGRVREHLHGLELGAAAQMLHAPQGRGRVHQRIAEVRRHVQKMLHGIVDHLNQAEHQQDLDDHRHHPQHGGVFFPLVQRHGLVRDGVLVPVMGGGDPVDLRLEPDHLDGVLLHHNGQGQQDDLAEEGEQQDGDSVVPDQPVAQIHDPSQRRADIGVDEGHRFSSLLSRCNTPAGYSLFSPELFRSQCRKQRPASCGWR